MPKRNDGIYQIPLQTGGVVDVVVTNPICQDETVRFDESFAGKQKDVGLLYLPGEVTPTCAVPNVTVRIDDKEARLGVAQQFTFGDTISLTRRVKVEFISVERGVDPHTVDVKPHGKVEVKCDL